MLKDVCFAPGDLPCAIGCRVRQKMARAGQPALTAWKKSEEGIVVAGETSYEYHRGLTPAKARTVLGPNGTGKWLWLSKSMFLSTLCSSR
ncbi:MAG: hypothetical protein LWX52_07485 [Deltaproteobacteria bacterium]|nr:hypothetical protein [Deltaproteobacteria bacterium]